MDREKTGQTSTTTRSNTAVKEFFEGDCPTGFARADDGTCQQLE